MKYVPLTLLHLAVTAAKLCGPGRVRAVIAENLLLKQQLIVLRRSRRRAPNLTVGDRLLCGFGSLFLRPERIRKVASGDTRQTACGASTSSNASPSCSRATGCWWPWTSSPAASSDSACTAVPSTGPASVAWSSSQWRPNDEFELRALEGCLALRATRGRELVVAEADAWVDDLGSGPEHRVTSDGTWIRGDA